MVENSSIFEISRGDDIQLLCNRFNELIESGKSVGIFEQLYVLMRACKRWQGERITIKSRNYSHIYRGNLDEGDQTIVQWDKTEQCDARLLDIIVAVHSSFSEAKLKYVLYEDWPPKLPSRVQLLPFCLGEGGITIPGIEGWHKGIEITNIIGNLYTGTPNKDDGDKLNLHIHKSCVQRCKPYEQSEEEKLLRINENTVWYDSHIRKRVDITHKDLITLFK